MLEERKNFNLERKYFDGSWNSDSNLNMQTHITAESGNHYSMEGSSSDLNEHIRKRMKQSNVRLYEGDLDMDVLNYITKTEQLTERMGENKNYQNEELIEGNFLKKTHELNFT